jgi:hypothetical protein
VTLEETILELTTRTPCGSGFWIGDNYVNVRYTSDSWEWEYRGNVFYDSEDLADEILKKNGFGARLATHCNESGSDGCRP